jgi:BolA-like protein 1
LYRREISLIYLKFSRRGLSGSTASEIEAVPPEFIQEAQIGQSLTPGRNNGFLNMLAVMKRKARFLRDTMTTTAKASEDVVLDTETNTTTDDRPMYHGIIAALQVLRPTKLKLIDNSHQHAGHAGSKGYNGESHFELEIVAEVFEGLNLVKRHKLVYMLLGDIMPKIHALQISAKTPVEVA